MLEENLMGKKKKSSGSSGSQGRTRINPLTGAEETIPGTKAGKKRTRTAFGDPLRTHISVDKVGKKSN